MKAERGKELTIERRMYKLGSRAYFSFHPSAFVIHSIITPFTFISGSCVKLASSMLPARKMYFLS